MSFPLTIYVAYHPDTRLGPTLAEGLHTWLSSSHLGDPGEVLNVYVRRRPPADILDRTDALRNLVVVLVDANVVGDRGWRRDIYALAVAHEISSKHPERHGVTLLQITLDGSFGALDLLAGKVNYARLGRWDDKDADPRPQFNRIVTQQALECLRKTEGPRRIFVSHARPDGMNGVGIAEQLQLTALRIGQQEVWFDGNDLGWGGDWQRHLTQTPCALPAFIAILSDQYASREWCLRELASARKLTPTASENVTLWRPHAVVVVDALEKWWSQIPDEMGGLPVVRWDRGHPRRSAANVLDRVGREALIEEYRAQRTFQVLKLHGGLLSGRQVVAFSTPPDAFSAGQLEKAAHAAVVLPVYRVDRAMRDRVVKALGVGEGAVYSYYELMRGTKDNPVITGNFRGTLVFSMGMPAISELGDFLPGHLATAVYRWARAALDVGWRVAYRGDPVKGGSLLERSLIDAARAAAFERGERTATNPEDAVRREEDDAPLVCHRQAEMSEAYSSLLGVCQFVEDVLTTPGPRVLLVVGADEARLVEDLRAWGANPAAPLLVLPSFGAAAGALVDWLGVGGAGPFGELEAQRGPLAAAAKVLATDSTGEVRQYLRSLLGDAPERSAAPLVALFGSHSGGWWDEASALLTNRGVRVFDPRNPAWSSVTEETGDAHQNLVDDLVAQQHEGLRLASCVVYHLARRWSAGEADPRVNAGDLTAFAARCELGFLAGVGKPTFVHIEPDVVGRNYLWAMIRLYPNMMRCSTLAEAVEGAANFGVHKQ